MPQNTRNPDRTCAISEVFGVMLVLAITIIVAGVITAFAGGFTLDSGGRALSANIVVSQIVLDPGHHSACVVFDHMSGDPVDLDGIRISLGARSSDRERTVIDNSLDPTGVDESGSPLSRYIAGYGEEAVTRITPGGRFALYADGFDDDGIFWQSSDSPAPFVVEFSDHLTYQIIDTRSKRVISSGMVAVPEPA